jgi:hypothetical protein
VSVRGHETIVIMSVEDYERLVPVKVRRPLLEFMENLSLADLDLERDRDHGRDVEL